ncbi:L-type lectin-domain containing receptor kinase IX.2-like isoform X1 [Rhododendron vialii]|uniref:L-type lectin-domain containing receptor kinase IX.2-like isoform X1 n=1 Tax=Rhododendron vialii TaxID=182163 RepID=UPI0026604B65|nr:L-type lectin-domain containing receptor kinase IX.2-like isoform X1 [Rhododendron vialii]
MAIQFAFEELESYTNRFETLLGEGAFSKVYRGNIPGNNPRNLPAQSVAIKVSNNPEDPQFENELQFLQQIQGHRNIIGLVGWCQTESKFYIVLDLASGGTLSNNIVGSRGKEEL